MTFDYEALGPTGAEGFRESGMPFIHEPALQI